MQPVDPLEEDTQLVRRLLFFVLVLLLRIALLFFLRVRQRGHVPESTENNGAFSDLWPARAVILRWNRRGRTDQWFETPGKRSQEEAIIPEDLKPSST